MEAELLRARLEEDVRRVVSAPSAGALERLREDVLQSYTSARIRLEVASRRVARRGLEATLALIQDAQHAIDRFRRQASLWRDLAAAEIGTRRRVALDAVTTDLAQLLETEARVHRVELRADALEAVQVSADPRALARSVFSAILEAIAAAGAGGAVHVSTRPARGGHPATLDVRAEPAGATGASVERLLSFETGT
jgi:signal transduction histidine kinase